MKTNTFNGYKKADRLVFDLISWNISSEYLHYLRKLLIKDWERMSTLSANKKAKIFSTGLMLRTDLNSTISPAISSLLAYMLNIFFNVFQITRYLETT